MNEPQSTEVQPVSEMHARLLAFRKQVVAEHEQATAAYQAKLADLDAAIAAVIVRQPTPVAPQIDREQCRMPRCGGWLTRRDDGVLVHERDGQIACQPGHSGPVASPLEQTTQFPAVQPPADSPMTWKYGDKTWDLTAQLVDHSGDVWDWTGHFAGGEPIYQSATNQCSLPGLLRMHGPINYRDRIEEPAEVPDAFVASPSATQPDGQVKES